MKLNFMEMHETMPFSCVEMKKDKSCKSFVIDKQKKSFDNNTLSKVMCGKIEDKFGYNIRNAFISVLQINWVKNQDSQQI